MPSAQDRYLTLCARVARAMGREIPDRDPKISVITEDLEIRVVADDGKSQG